jgi:hypothetical protein
VEGREVKKGVNTQQDAKMRERPQEGLTKGEREEEGITVKADRK